MSATLNTIEYQGQEIQLHEDDIIKKIIELIIKIIEALATWPSYRADIQYATEADAFNIYYDDSLSPLSITQEQKEEIMAYRNQILNYCGISDPVGDSRFIVTL